MLADALAEQGLHHEALAIRADHGLRLGLVESLEALGTDDAAAAGRRERGASGRWVCRRATAEHADDERFAEGAALSLDEAAAYARRARGSRRRPDSGWESLTTAEREVVRLAVDGLSNPEIGAPGCS